MSKEEKDSELVAVKWIRPGHRHHNVVHLVSRSLVKPHPDGDDRVIVRWPLKGKEPDNWEGTLEHGSSRSARASGAAADQAPGRAHNTCAEIQPHPPAAACKKTRSAGNAAQKGKNKGKQ